MSSLRSLDQMCPAEVTAMVTAGGEEQGGYEAQMAFANRRMLSTLSTLGVRPFWTKKVERYKKNKLHPRLGAFGMFLSDLDIPVISNVGWSIAIRHWNSAWEVRPLGREFPEHTPPEQVAELATRIRVALPSAELEVHSFRADPFLVVRDPDFPDVYFYVAVWDEAGFKIAYS